eukprot:5888308-Alexandrium_andersonii.AAC.1
MPETDEGAPPGVALVRLQESSQMKLGYVRYTRLQVAIDSGAAGLVIPERLLQGHRVVPSEGSKRVAR